MAVKYYSLSELARKWGKHRQQVSRWVSEGRLKTTTIAGHPVVAASDAIQPEPNKPGPKPKKPRNSKRRAA